PVAGKRKAELLSQAKAFIFPILWPEPFGLVVAEALMSGTPVLAFKRGSLPELVTQDVGRLFETEQEWVEYLREDRIEFDPEACRVSAMKRFHYSQMAQHYEVVYDRVIRGEKLNSTVPVGGDWRLQT
ncbi:MAG: glycosyltransferase, partial [Bdellovibrionia bacterium]